MVKNNDNRDDTSVRITRKDGSLKVYMANASGAKLELKMEGVPVHQSIFDVVDTLRTIWFAVDRDAQVESIFKSIKQSEVSR